MTMMTAANLWGFGANAAFCHKKSGPLGYLCAFGMG